MAVSLFQSEDLHTALHQQLEAGMDERLAQVAKVALDVIQEFNQQRE